MTVTLLCILFVISLCRTTLIPHLAVYGITPDIYLVFTVFFSLNTEVKQSSFVNWINGIAKDVFSLASFGLSAFLFVLIGYIIGRSKEFVFKEHPLTQVLITFFAALLYGLGCIVLLLLSSENVKCAVITQKMLCSAVYSAIVAPLLFAVFKKFKTGLRLSRSITFEKKV
ncbi:MAG: rod shape-determining protein MreD [Candidatus Anammoxibacter sp.]